MMIMIPNSINKFDYVCSMCECVWSGRKSSPYIYIRVVTTVQNGDKCWASPPWSCSFDKLILILSLCKALLWQMIYYLEGKWHTRHGISRHICTNSLQINGNRCSWGLCRDAGLEEFLVMCYSNMAWQTQIAHFIDCCNMLVTTRGAVILSHFPSAHRTIIIWVWYQWSRMWIVEGTINLVYNPC